MSAPFDIDHKWREFESKVIPADAGREQRRGMRAAFYIGATAVFRGLTGAALDTSTPDATASDLRVMDNLDKALRRFEYEVRHHARDRKERGR